MNKKDAKRGRGRGIGAKYSRNNQKNIAASSFMGKVLSFDENSVTAEEKFNQAKFNQTKDVESMLKKYSAGFESSSDEEDLNDEEIFNKLTTHFKEINTDGEFPADLPLDVSLGATAQFLTESCQSGALTCLVCISSVKRHEQVWSCEKCFGIFHLPCIKQWVLEGIAQSTLLSDEHFPNRDRPWYCPKCRHEYLKSKCPQVYKCFCGSKVNPPHDPWLVPHSCGAKCDKTIKNPLCGHRCLLLCHPGPCPPCPQTVAVTCYCGKQPKKLRRCGRGAWSCNQSCDKLLPCKKHRCKMQCHSGECHTCDRSSLQDCVCRSERRIQPCMTPTWKCDKICNKQLSCGFHRCKEVCHKPGNCGECPKSGDRVCPCGKLLFPGLRCDEEVTTCQDTCGKNLGCYGNHTCSRKCHFGDCGTCPLVTKKPCRCGKREKEVPCQKEYFCESKCQKIRSCGNHQCKKKCCIGDCPPCEQICGKTLQCKKHKCQMGCHQGPCYPCPLMTTVTCRCGTAVINVVCGMEKITKPPRCRKLCEIKSDCHHEKRVKHTCHFGKCPPCKQICGLELKCSHTCPSLCHDNVVIKNQDHSYAPWQSNQSEYKLVRLDCPPCKVPVGVVCRGGHETGTFPCSEARDYSCGRECGFPLKCGNHNCTNICHVVHFQDEEKKVSLNCMTCDQPCMKERPPGCMHPCSLSCHLGECPPCHKRIKTKCHCGGVPMKHLCSDWTSRSDEARNRMASCGSNCPRTLTPCGHLCPLQCHSGECPQSVKCLKRVILRCPCKRKKKEFVCGQLQTQQQKIDCDDICKQIKINKQAEKDAIERQKREEEERKQREEVEKFERKLHRRSRVRRRDSAGNEEQKVGRFSQIISNSKLGVVVFALVVVAAIGFAYYATVV